MSSLCDFQLVEGQTYRCTKCGQEMVTDCLPIFATCGLDPVALVATPPLPVQVDKGPRLTPEKQARLEQARARKQSGCGCGRKKKP